jgi:hypothetical protein
MQFILALGIALATPAISDTYGDTLIAKTLARHREVSGIAISATAKDGRPIRVARGKAGGESLPLVNSMGDPVGTVTIRFARIRHLPAHAIAAEISRSLYLADNLIEADPFAPGAHRSAKGQAIVDATMAANPDLVTLAMHVGSSGADNAILASNFGRIGKAGDKDDAKVIDGGVTLRETTNGGKRLAVSLPLLDRRGRVVGSLSTSFKIGAGGADAAAARAVTVRDAIARRIGSLTELRR